MTEPPSLTAILIVGSLRARSQRSLDALGRQRGGSSMEIVVGDLASLSKPRLTVNGHAPVVYLDLPRDWSWGRARVEALRHARSEIVAFMEDHCYVEEGWAEALIEAHKGPWAAVSYVFTNANPETYISRSSFIADYGLWSVPTRGGPAKFLPCGNVSYKKAALLDLGADLEETLTPDLNLQETFLRHGKPMYIESRAVAAHENWVRPGSLVRAKFGFCRTLAARRVRTQKWGWLRRLAQAAATPLSGPLVQALRLAFSLKGRLRLAPSFLAAFPIVLLGSLGAAMGETIGYLLGEEQNRDLPSYWELEAERDEKGGRP